MCKPHKYEHKQYNPLVDNNANYYISLTMNCSLILKNNMQIELIRKRNDTPSN